MKDFFYKGIQTFTRQQHSRLVQVEKGLQTTKKNETNNKEFFFHWVDRQNNLGTIRFLLGSRKSQENCNFGETSLVQGP